MGKHLQIRVMAQTYDPEAPVRDWPVLCATARIAAGAQPGPPRDVTADILLLVQALHDSLNFGPWSKDYKQALASGMEEARRLARQLEAALADWDPRTADSLSYALEDALNKLERVAARHDDAPEPMRP